MKTIIYPVANSGTISITDIYRKVLFLFFLLTISIITLAGPGNGPDNGLTFNNAYLVSGVEGADGAVYRFPGVDAELDALVKITGRSSNKVKLLNIDINTAGHKNAFQPQVTYGNNNTPSGYTDWWMEFEISFVEIGSSKVVNVKNFDVSGIDIDGNSDKIREYVTFFKASSYKLESHSLLKVSDILYSLLGILTPGKRFEGPVANYASIDTSGTSVMVTNHYSNVNSFRMRTGGVSTGSNGAADRMYSFYFKSFQYVAPKEFQLPLVLNDFNASLKDTKVSLKWETGMEKELSHFVIERSTDGMNYTDAGMVFAMGNSGVKQAYQFGDDIKVTTKGILYYRLRMVDMDGRYQHSEIRMIKAGNIIEEIRIQTYPNPVVNELRITIPSAWQDNEVNYELYNLSGNLVKRSSKRFANQTETISLSDVKAGMYVVKVSTVNNAALQRIIKQ